MCLVNADSELGYKNNPWVFALLKDWLKAVVIVNKSSSIVDNVLGISKNKLSYYFNDPNLVVDIINSDGQRKKIMKCNNVSATEHMHFPLQINSYDFSISRPDGFIPTHDLIEDGEYKIFMDVPGIAPEKITLKKKNSTTMVQGERVRPVPQDGNITITKQERKFGQFIISFKIPDDYRRKWDRYEVKDGVLMIAYKKEEDED